MLFKNLVTVSEEKIYLKVHLILKTPCKKCLYCITCKMYYRKRTNFVLFNLQFLFYVVCLYYLHLIKLFHGQLDKNVHSVFF